MDQRGNRLRDKSPSCPAVPLLLPSSRRGPLLGSFEENVLNNRLEPIRIVDGYRAEVRASGHFQPRPLCSTVRVSFFSAGDSFPYLGQIHIGHRGYRIPKQGTLQVTLFNPLGTVVKLFLLLYDLNDMPPNSQTFLRQRTIFVPCDNRDNHCDKDDDNNNNQHNASRNSIDGSITRDSNSTCGDSSGSIYGPEDNHKARKSSPMLRVRYLIQLNIVSSKSGRIYLNKDLRIFISRKVDLEAAAQLTEQDFELKSFDEMPRNPRYFTR